MKLLALLVPILISQAQCQHNRFKWRLNFFDVELLRATADKGGNVIISPASVKSTLAMLLAGADGSTARELEQALRVFPSKDDVGKEFRLFLNALNSNTSTAVLKNANAIFVSKKLKLNPKYESVVKHDYSSEVNKLDFSESSVAATAINKWVSDNTNGFIPFIVEPAHVSQNTEIVVANALFFKSSWHHAFNPRATKPACFYYQECKMVSMMTVETELKYAHVEDLRAHAVEIPYVGKRYSMIILVPLFKDGIDALLRDLPYVSLSQITDMMYPETVLLSMPKFTLNFEENLVEPLRKLKITSLFSSESNLSRIFEGDVPHVNNFYHKVYLSVDEVGTVAAAASSAMVVPLIYTGRVEVRADRPFVFFIRDNELGIVMFEGIIVEPTLDDNHHQPISSPELTKKVSSPVQNHSVKSKSGFVENLKSIFG